MDTHPAAHANPSVTEADMHHISEGPASSSIWSLFFQETPRPLVLASSHIMLKCIRMTIFLMKMRLRFLKKGILSHSPFNHQAQAGAQSMRDIMLNEWDWPVKHRTCFKGSSTYTFHVAGPILMLKVKSAVYGRKPRTHLGKHGPKNRIDLCRCEIFLREPFHMWNNHRVEKFNKQLVSEVAKDTLSLFKFNQRVRWPCHYPVSRESTSVWLCHQSLEAFTKNPPVQTNGKHRTLST